MEEDEIKEEEQVETEDDQEQEENNQLFINNLNSTLFVKRNHNKKEYNYEWLDLIEQIVPYIDNILRNPKRFIMNDEEVVKVELSKKVTVESVIHLTQHTNLIQKIEDNGDVKPSKILNINKEESLDTYENRFIYTLVNDLRMFFENRIATTSNINMCVDKNKLHYEANSKVNGQDLKISLDVDDITKNIEENGGSNERMTYSERVSKLKKQIDGFFGTELMMELSRLHVSPVRSPIKKTNVILKNPNFQKAEELWNFMQTYESKDNKELTEKEFYDRGLLKNEYDQAFLSTYLANKNYIDESNQATETNIINQMIRRLIDNIMDTNIELTEDKILTLFKKQIEIKKENNNQKKARIYDILENRLNRELDSFNHMLEILEEGDNT